ncbi:MAG: protein-export chaperone SecB [Rhodospirillales bacterium]|nr:protein-export chaperone SecB [Rhodospirillales bacterium]
MEPSAPAAPRPSLVVTGQYLKDLSFESPRLPFYRTLNSPPRDEVSLGIKIAQIKPDIFEVALVIHTAEKRDEAAGFILEFIYAGVFNLTGFPPEHRDAALYIEAPELLFPFARKILTRLLQINGFPYRMPPAFDFVGRYADELGRKREGGPGFA